MAEGVTIRRATAADAEVFLGLVDALADYEKLERPSREARGRLVRDAFGEQPRFTAYLAELDGIPVGYAIAFPTYSSFLALPTLYLEDIFVLPTARKRGAGLAMMRHLAREAVAMGCGRMEWSVLDWNRLAIDFYERLGARHMQEWYGYRLTRNQLEEIAAAE